MCIIDDLTNAHAQARTRIFFLSYDHANARANMNMAMDVDVAGLVRSLCSSFLKEALTENCNDELLRNFIRPSRW